MNLVYKAPLCIYGGANAIKHIKHSHLSPEDIKVVVGAAGGPKWLVLHGLDQYLFGDFLSNKKTVTHLLGSSIGAWRFAAYCKDNFQSAFEQFEDIYFNQSYSEAPDSNDISTVIDTMLDQLFSDQDIEQILNNKQFKLNFFTDRCRGLLNTHNKWSLGSGLLLSTIFNLFSRQSLALFFERTLFHHPTDFPPFINLDDFKTQKVPITTSNLKQAVRASGSIPLVIEGVENIAGAKEGIYRDGGMIDYHMALPYGVKDGIILLPHFSKTVIPGWLDKFVKIRKANPKYLENVLLIAPTDDFIKSLPLSKIPDRTDFNRFSGDNKSRIAYWKEVTERSKELSLAFESMIQDGSLINHIKPFN